MSDTDKTGYWVRENRKQWCATVHKAECNCCNNGNGHRAKLNGSWHGPYQTCTEAFRAAGKLKKNVKHCKLCQPQPSQ